MTTVLWGAGVVLFALVVPMVVFVLREQPWSLRESGGPTQGAPVRQVGTLYTVETVLRFPYEDEGSFVPRRSETGASYLEVVAPSADGGFWLVHHPPERGAVPFVRRIARDGKVLAAFDTTLGATLFTPSRSGDLWVDVAMGAGDREHVVRYGPDGSVKGIYQLPRGFLARALTMDPDGGVWALSEEWSIDPESKQVHLNNALVPVALPGSFQAPSDPLSLVLEGSFFGEDGLLYRVRSDGRVEEGHVSPPYEVTSWTKSGSKVASYSLPPDVRPFAADAQGRLYAEHLAPEQPVAAGLSSVGDPANEAAMLWIVERDGSLTKLPVPRQDLFTEWAPIAWPRADGRLVTTKVDGVSLAVLELKPVNRRAVDAQAPFDPEVTVIEPTEPMSGDPYAAIDVAQRDLMKLVYSGLVSFDGSLTPVPDLARRVPTKANGLISPDGKTIRWEMRTDVRWHDGRSVTPGDVVATYRYLRYTSYLPHGRPFPGFDAIEDVRAEGDSVIVRLSRPVGVASEAFFPFVLPAHALPGTPTANPELFAKPVGCGPYRLVRWEDGSGWYLQAHDAGSRLPGRVRSVHVVFAYGDRALQRFRSARTPVIWDWVDEASVAELRKKGQRVAEHLSGRWWAMVLNPRRPPTADLHVRKAVRASYPEETLSSRVYPQSETSTPVDPFPPVAKAHEPRRGPIQGDDLESARTLLMSGGWRLEGDAQLARKVWKRSSQPLAIEGLSTHRAWNDSEIPLEAMDALQLRWREMGALDRYDPASMRHYESWWRGGALSTGAYIVGLGVFPGHPDPGWGGLFDPTDRPSAANPYGIGVCAPEDPLLETLYARAREEYDPDKRAELGRRIVRRAMDELVLAIGERYEMRRVAIAGTVQGFAPQVFPAGAFSDVSQWAFGHEGR